MHGGDCWKSLLFFAFLFPDSSSGTHTAVAQGKGKQASLHAKLHTKPYSQRPSRADT